MSVLKSHSGWKTKYFKGMSLEEIREKFIRVWKQIKDFMPMASKKKEKDLREKDSGIPTASDEFPLPDYFPTASKERANCIENLTKDLELLKKEKGELETKLTSFQTASKDLDSLLESQRLDKNKERLGYSDVPPPPAQIYSPPKKDMSWTGLSEFADDTVTDYSRPSPAIESTSDDVQNKNPSVTKTEASPSTISSKPFIKFVKPADRPTVVKTEKKETVRKPSIKYVELYRKSSKKSTVRGNQRN
nr:hypothetical protein [Tanacetum cinerariifolium]